jgi:hypothetical protein
MNGDGYEEIVVGCPQATITTGIVFVYGGGPDIDDSFDAAIARSGDAFFGESVASLGDVTGDGLSDIIIGAPRYQFLQDKGYWGIFKGDSDIVVSDVSEKEPLPQQAELQQNYPNPFNPATTISYVLSARAVVTLKVYDVLGRELTTLENDTREAGRHTVEFDGSMLSSGVYFYRLRVTLDGSKARTYTKAMVLMK